MVAMTARGYGVYYAAVSLRNGQALVFQEAATSIHEAMKDLKEELFKESWDAILLVEGYTGRELYEGSAKRLTECRSELTKEYPSLFRKQPTEERNWVLPGATTWAAKDIVGFSDSILANTTTSIL